MKALISSTLCAGLMLSATPAAAADTVTITTAKSEEHGTYLADGVGRPLYLFTADTRGNGDRRAEIACEGECLEAWPPLHSEGEPGTEGSAVEESLLGTVEHDNEQVVTYNGWPLYYFVKDQGAVAPQGQDIESFGGEWYLVTPEGEKVEHD